MAQIVNLLLWNACLAGVLAVVIFLVQRIHYLRNRPHVCHTLWLLVLVKLVTPPLFTVHVSLPATRSEQLSDLLTVVSPTEDEATSANAELFRLGRQDEETILTQAANIILTPQNALAVSALGSLVVLLASLSRVRLIGRLVRHTEPAPQWMQEVAALESRELKLKRVPSIRVVDGTVSPFLWTTLSGPLIVLPCQLIAAVGPDGARLIIGHEMSHYARRDHWTNTFATILAMLFWWNPVVGWARRELRILQEWCCDRMVIAQDISQRVRYAETLLKAVDFVASSDAISLSPATAFGSCDRLKRRVEMIVSQNPNPFRSLWARACVFVCALVALPFGMTNAQDYDAIEKRLGKAVAKGEISIEQAKVMMEALRRSDNRHAAEGGMPLAVERRSEKSRSLEDAEDREAKARKLRYAELEREIDAAVEAGKVSREEAKEKLNAVRKDLFSDHSQDDDLATRKKRFAAIQDEIDAAVEAGKVSREEAKEKLNAVRKDLFSDHSQDDDLAARKKRFAAIQDEIDAAVEAGKVSREEAKEKLNAVRKDLFSDHSQDDDLTARKKRFAAIQGEIDAAVDAGKVSREEAEEKLNAVRKEVFQD